MFQSPVEGMRNRLDVVQVYHALKCWTLFGIDEAFKKS